MYLFDELVFIEHKWNENFKDVYRKLIRNRIATAEWKNIPPPCQINTLYSRHIFIIPYIVIIILYMSYQGEQCDFVMSFSSTFFSMLHNITNALVVPRVTGVTGSTEKWNIIVIIRFKYFNNVFCSVVFTGKFSFWDCEFHWSCW